MTVTVNHIGISGGKDSTALLLWAVHESGYDRATLDVTFCDTGNEAPSTYEYIAMLSETVHPITTLKPERDFWELALHKRIFPSAKRRFCTEFLKIYPSQDHLRSLLDAGKTVRMHSGVRANESPRRAKLAERSVDEDWFGCEVYRPLLKWTIEDVWAIHARYGIARNPLYAMGMRRVGCFPCIMSSKRELLQIARRYPDRVVELVAKERELNEALGTDNVRRRSFFHAATVPTSQRSVEGIDRDGNPVKVASVEDIFRWATTKRGGQQYQFNDLIEEIDGDYAVCESGMGACE